MKSNNDAVIVAMGRSAIGDFGGALKNLRAHQLGAQMIRGVLTKVPELDPGLLDDVILGDCMQCPDEATTARTTALAAGIPDHVPAVTIQRQCASAMEALAQASNRILLGDADLIIAGGVECMSNAFYCLPAARWGARLRHGVMMDSMWEMLHSGSTVLDPPGYIMGQTAENLAQKHKISRLRSSSFSQAMYWDGKNKTSSPYAVIKTPRQRLIRVNLKKKLFRLQSPDPKETPLFLTPMSMSAGD